MEVKQDIIQNFNYSFQFIKQQYRVLSLFDIFAVKYIGFNIASLHYTHCHLDISIQCSSVLLVHYRPISPFYTHDSTSGFLTSLGMLKRKVGRKWAKYAKQVQIQSLLLYVYSDFEFNTGTICKSPWIYWFCLNIQKHGVINIHCAWTCSMQ